MEKGSALHSSVEQQTRVAEATASDTK